MVSKLVGRKKEQEVLQKALQSDEAEMVSVIGRRRIGKTFLIKTVYREHIVFEATGVKDASSEDQIQGFKLNLFEKFGVNAVDFPINDWMTAFFALTQQLKKITTPNKLVIVLDEVPWFSAKSTDFIQGLSWFWNNWAVNQNIVVVLCGSSASWMIQKIVNDKGGLHNRITRRIYLKPFTLAETALYLKSRHINLDHYHILQLYMAMGGIPHYLKEIETGKSAAQNIDDICFSETGILRDEFSNLFSSLFDDSYNHIAVVRALAKTRQGIDQKALMAATKIPNADDLAQTLEELQQSGFIDISQSFAKKAADKLYRLTDEYSLFYLQFIENQGVTESGIWLQLCQSQAYKIWSRSTFKGICLKFIPQIKKALSIGGVYSVPSSFVKKGTDTEKGTQIDLLLDRADNVINIFEIKFYSDIFSVTKATAQNWKAKMRVFRETTQTKKHLFLTLISTFGITPNEHSIGTVDQILTVEDLFLD